MEWLHFLVELNHHQYKAKEENGDEKNDETVVEWQTRSLCNNGIELSFRGARLRIRNASGMPAPMTISTRNFYQQSLFPDQDFESVNLLILFKLSPEGKYDGNFRLIRPNRAPCAGGYEWSTRLNFPVVNGAGIILPDYLKPSDLPIVRDGDTEEYPDLFEGVLAPSGTDEDDS